MITQERRTYTRSDLMRMSRSELDKVFMEADKTALLPHGKGSGTAIFCPGTFWTGLLARVVRRIAWQGKVFTLNADRKSGTLTNDVGPVGVDLIVARVYETTSWLDKEPCIILDYSKTSLFARKIRDEIRIVNYNPTVYLGKVWWGKTRLIDFILEFPYATIPGR